MPVSSRGTETTRPKRLPVIRSPPRTVATGCYGDYVYAVGFTAWQSRDGLEERLHRLGAPEIFLPLPAAIRFDALYFIDTMETI